ncbi:GP16 [Agrotis ipsilon multiple nucleopolyhedrovirus]|uniref:GP16 n=1 Tax=Agrotis ipsilon multiple nucleopolyhedrovirus TaxID=208013 RepID=B6D5S8_9ABAC|nr:GP16 [Agrotis ipsilon multiple nucleopolyhedrovirus]ACI28716.1 GP16 [Agrotis ipsilon multiple nucleopolyhedrovirus]
MNYSAVALVLLAAYLWHANSLHNELNVIKKLLVVIFENAQARFDAITANLAEYHESVLTSLAKLHNMTKYSVDLVLVNSKKIDVINNKIDSLLESH